MRLNHLSFPSNDVAASVAFFERQLGCRVELAGPVSILKRDGFDIVIEDCGDRTTVWPHNFHLGFELPSADEVRAMYQRFKQDGVTMKTEVFYHERGSRFFCEAPGGLLFEINTRADAEERYRRTFADAVK
ncbi:VOC family protein [Rugamonas rivuli]|uniref:VOC family protein n=1 Tax=Rugamonas rivuli TaxID=2743358 RepID=A0A843S5I5_9BURK|nr:VOC family protein [Rugamonas rivuli]MQA19605.1 VOC family protein [Rugamonas rivuli]